MNLTYNKRIKKYYRQIYSLPDQFYVYRAINIIFEEFIKKIQANDYLRNYKGLGSYWTYDIKYAINYENMSKGKEVIILVARIEKSRVNWKKSEWLEKSNINLEKIIYLNPKTSIMVEKIIRCSTNQIISIGLELKI